MTTKSAKKAGVAKANVEAVEVSTEAANTNAARLTRESLYKSTKQIDEAIIQAVANGNSVQQEYQKIACSAILHLATHGDIRVIRNLRDTLPEGMRKKSMDTFIDKFAPVAYDDEGQVHFDKERKLDLAGALAMDWWKAAKEPTYVPFDLLDKTAHVIELADKRAKKLKPEQGDSIPSDLLGELVAVVNKHKALRQAQEASEAA